MGSHCRSSSTPTPLPPAPKSKRIGAADGGGRQWRMWTDPNSGAAHDKLHLHWRLAVPTRTAIEHDFLRECRKLATTIAGADASNIPALHPIRWPGSWHRKATPRLARIVLYNLDIEIDWKEALNQLRAATPDNTGNDANEDGGPQPRRSGDPQADPLESARRSPASPMTMSIGRLRTMAGRDGIQSVSRPGARRGAARPGSPPFAPGPPSPKNSTRAALRRAGHITRPRRPTRSAPAPCSTWRKQRAPILSDRARAPKRRLRRRWSGASGRHRPDPFAGQAGPAIALDRAAMGAMEAGDRALWAGGEGKTLLCQQLMSACALGRPWVGQHAVAVKSLGIFCEDDEDELHRRQADIDQLYDCDFTDLENMKWLARLGCDNLLLTFNGHRH